MLQGPAVEKAVDCLRILTTGNDANKVSLFSIPAAMPALVRLMQATDQVSPRLHVVQQSTQIMAACIRTVPINKERQGRLQGMEHGGPHQGIRQRSWAGQQSRL